MSLPSGERVVPVVAHLGASNADDDLPAILQDLLDYTHVAVVEWLEFVHEKSPLKHTPINKLFIFGTLKNRSWIGSGIVAPILEMILALTLAPKEK